MTRPVLACGSRADHLLDMSFAFRPALIGCLLALSTAGIFAAELPETMEPPRQRPEAAPAAEKPADAPLPAAKPPLPAAKAHSSADADAPMPAEEAACRKRLSELGVVFAEHPPISEPEGCSAPHPLTVSRLPGDVELRPDAVLTCAMAEATARFVRDRAAPMAREEFEAELVAINQVSSYVCRPRNGTKKLSEHAYANALDWGSIELDDGTMIEVRAFQRSEPRRARLVSGLREAACGQFTTVLGPGSDADHADHFHFDLAERRNGGTFCQ